MSVLTALRDCISSGGHPHISGEVVHLLPGVTLPRKSPTAWRYRKGGYLDLESIIFFLDNERLVLSLYVKAATAADVQIIPFAERKPLLEYLRGGKDGKDSTAYHEIDQEREQRQQIRHERRLSASGTPNLTPRTTPTLSARTLRRLSHDMSQPPSKPPSPSALSLLKSSSASSASHSSASAVRLPGWVWWWLLVSSLVMLVDSAFLFLRPHSLPGGSLHSYFTPYDTYVRYDPSYLDTADPFTRALAITSTAQVAGNMATLLLTMVAPHSALSALLAVCVSAGTLCVTLFFFLFEALSVAGAVEHRYRLTDVGTWDLGYALGYVGTTSLWVFFPLAIIVVVGGQLVRAADGTAGRAAVAKNKKE